MKFLDYSGVQRLWAAMKDHTAEAAKYQPNVAREYDMGAQTDIAAYVAGWSKAALVYGGIATTKPAIVTVSDYAWTGPTADYRQTATADVIVTFPDGSSLTARGVRFISDYSAPGRVYAARLADGAGPIDTGLTMDYSYRFTVSGYAPEGNACVLVGAYASNEERTTLRILGGANKIQAMWPANREHYGSSLGDDLDFRTTFYYRQDGGEIYMRQGQLDAGEYHSGWQTSGTGAAKIYLFDESEAGTFRHGILHEARIYDGAGNILRYFQPAKQNNEIVIVDIANGNQVYRPTVGTLEEVTEQ